MGRGGIVTKFRSEIFTQASVQLPWAFGGFGPKEKWRVEGEDAGGHQSGELEREGEGKISVRTSEVWSICWWASKRMETGSSSIPRKKIRHDSETASGWGGIEKVQEKGRKERS